MCDIGVIRITADSEIWVPGQERDQVDHKDEDNDGCAVDEGYRPDGEVDDAADVDEVSDYVS